MKSFIHAKKVHIVNRAVHVPQNTLTFLKKGFRFSLVPVPGVVVVGVRLLFFEPELPKLSESSTLSMPFSCSIPKTQDQDLTHFHAGYFSCVFYHLLTFFRINILKKFFQEHYHRVK